MRSIREIAKDYHATAVRRERVTLPKLIKVEPVTLPSKDLDWSQCPSCLARKAKQAQRTAKSRASRAKPS